MYSDKRNRGVLAELTSYVPHQTRHHFVESRAQQMIAGFANLVQLIEESYDEETAEDLKKRLFNAVKSGDDRKFTRGMKPLKETDDAE